MPKCSAGDLEGKLKHVWQLTSSLYFYHQQQAALGRASHAWHEQHSRTLETVKLMNSSLSLVHACVTTLSAPAGEMAGICDIWLLILGEEIHYLGILKFGYKLSDKSCYMP